MRRKKQFRSLSQKLFIRLTLSVFCLSFLTSVVLGQASAQGQDKSVSVSKVERKNRAPVSSEILQVKLPRPVEVRLDNGLTVLIMEDHRFPTASVSLQIAGAGGLFQPRELPGLASVTAQMLREGTKTRDALKLAEDVDRLGATLNANAGISSITASVSSSGLSDNFDEWFSLLADILLHPTFPEEELTKLKQRLKASLRQQRSSPNFLARERFNKALFGEHPASVVSMTNESIDSFTTEKLAEWHRERYAPQNAILAIMGDVIADDLLPKLKNWLGAWKKTGLKVEMPANPVPVAKKQIYLVNRPGSVQTQVAIGNIAIDRKSPDYLSMVVLNRVLGSGPASRLFINLREEKGYTYGVYSTFSATRYPGAFQVGGAVRSEPEDDATDGAMAEFLYELMRLTQDPVPSDELEEAKRAMVARFALSLERPATALNRAITIKTYGFPEDYWDTYPAKLMEVGSADVQRVAKKYIQPGALQFVAVGDASLIQPVLEKYGPVEVFDTEGKPVDMEALAAEKAAAEAAAAGPAANVAGKWEVLFSTPAGDQTLNLTLEQDGTELKGSLVGPRGRESPVKGTVRGTVIEFTVTRQVPGREIEMKFSGNVEGTSMVGKVQIMDFSNDWSAKKVE